MRLTRIAGAAHGRSPAQGKKKEGGGEKKKGKKTKEQEEEGVSPALRSVCPTYRPPAVLTPLTRANPRPPGSCATGRPQSAVCLRRKSACVLKVRRLSPCQSPAGCCDLPPLTPVTSSFAAELKAQEEERKRQEKEAHEREVERARLRAEELARLRVEVAEAHGGHLLREERIRRAREEETARVEVCHPPLLRQRWLSASCLLRRSRLFPSPTISHSCFRSTAVASVLFMLAETRRVT